jgi:hypothetical protein
MAQARNHVSDAPRGLASEGLPCSLKASNPESLLLFRCLRVLRSVEGLEASESLRHAPRLGLLVERGDAREESAALDLAEQLYLERVQASTRPSEY